MFIYYILYVSATADDDGMKKIMLILIPSIAVPIAIALLLTLVCMCKRSKQVNGQHKPLGRPSQQLEMASLTAKMPLKATEFPISQVRFVQELGEGAFGKVYMGELIGYPSENGITKVAVKTLKENASPKVQTDFRREVELMTELKHPNIVCLIGVCCKDKPMCMLFEYMSQGDLHKYMCMRSPHSDVSVSDDEGASQILDHGEMLHIAMQIAAGMEYLASHHYVHRDLAARNILVGENLTVKIADFGLSRDVYSTDYYRVQSKSFLPVRWMAPESIMYGRFTVESDVWSFGVVLWEIYGYGLQPYYGYSNQEVIEMIRSRQILPCPEDCPSRIYSLMVECWNEIPASRPSFTKIHQRLRAWTAELQPQHMPPPQLMNYGLVGNAPSQHSGSGHSHPSHHSSTGPSNNTTTSGLSNPHQMPVYSHMNHMRPMHMVPQPIPPPPMPPMPQHRAHPSQYPHYGQQAIPQQQQPNGPGLYKKPSPPGSVASGKSSSGLTSSSNSSNLSTGGKPQQMNHRINPIPSPTTNMNNYNKFVNSVPSSAPLYIPDQMTSNIAV